MNIRVISSEDVEFKEKDVQRAIEKDLTKLEDSLVFIESEVTLGTGRIDTLAFDVENNQPVFIEYKGQGQFSKDALVQLMDYLSWFTKDPNHMAILEKYIKQKNATIEEIEPDIRLICVVSDIDARVGNAIYVISNWIKVYSYYVTKDSENSYVLIPKMELDNSEVERPVSISSSEGEILGKHPHLNELFEKLRPFLEKDGTRTYTTKRSFAFKNERVFAKIRFRKRYLFLELRAGKNNIADNEFKYWRQGESSWGYTHLYPSKDIQQKVIDWIEIARNYASQEGPEINAEERV